MIRFEMVSKAFANKYALKDINFEVSTPKLMFVTGHSGSGKSCLLKCLGAELSCDSGLIQVKNTTVTELSPSEKRKFRRTTGKMFEQPRIMDNCSVAENIALTLRLTQESKVVDWSRVYSALHFVGLFSKKDLLAQNLSTSEKQLVSLARAVVHCPSMLLADDPFKYVDPKTADMMAALFHQLSQSGIFVIVTSQNNAPHIRSADLVITLEAGKIFDQRAFYP